MPRSRFFAVVALECATCLVLVASTLGRDSLWMDEGATDDATGRSLGDTFSMIRDEETNGSLFHLLVKGSRAVFGDAEWAFRLPSAIAAVALVAAVAALADAILGRRAALLAGAVVAVHGSTLEYGRDARTYALYVLLVTLSMLGLVLDRRSPGRAGFALWVVAGAAAFYVHLFAALALAIQAATLLPAFGPVQQRGRRLAGIAAMVGLAAPLLVVVASRGTLEAQKLSPVGPYILRDVAFALAGGGWVVAVPAGAAFVAAVVAVLRRSPGGAGAEASALDLRLLVLWAVVPTVAAIVLSLPERVFEARYVLSSMVPLVLLVCWLVEERAHFARPAVAAVVAVAVLGGALGLAHRNEDWRGLTQTMVDESQPGDAVVFLDDFQVLVVEYYLRRDGFDPPEPTALRSVVPATDWGAFHIADWVLPDVSEAQFECAVAGRSRTWVLERDGADALDGRYPMLGWAEDRFGPGEVRFSDGIVTLHLYAAADGVAPVPAGRGC